MICVIIFVLFVRFLGLSTVHQLTRMGKTKYSSRYNPDWENPELYLDLSSWIQPVKTGKPDDANQFACKICTSGPLSLSNMGVTAPRSHLQNTKDKNGKLCKHNQKAKDTNTTKNDCVLQSTSSESATESELSQSLVVGEFHSSVSQSAIAEASQDSSSSHTEVSVKTWYLSTLH